MSKPCNKKFYVNKIYEEQKIIKKEKVEKIRWKISTFFHQGFLAWLFISFFFTHCSLFQSDSEYMAGQLSAFGYALIENPEEADLWLINTWVLLLVFLSFIYSSKCILVTKIVCVVKNDVILFN